MNIDSPYVLIGASVLMHVAWNLLARHAGRNANYLWWGLLAHLLMLGPYGLWHLWSDAMWERPLILALIVSAAANAWYFVALRNAYQYAPVALVYPLVRSSPLLIVAWSWSLFDETISAGELLGICVSVTGLWALAATSRGGDTRHALPWAMLGAFGTSVYSISDKVAVAFLPGFAAQMGFITVGYAASFVVLTLLQRRQTGRWTPLERPRWGYLLAGGLFIGTAYALVVRAMRDMPSAHVVSFTNAGIIVAVLLSVGVFGEREHWRSRLLASVVISGGLLLLAGFR